MYHQCKMEGMLFFILNGNCARLDSRNGVLLRNRTAAEKVGEDFILTGDYISRTKTSRVTFFQRKGKLSFVLMGDFVFPLPNEG